MPNSPYRDWFPELARWMARTGLKAEEIAKELGVSKKTLYKWRGQYPEFADAMDDGRDLADARVEDSLYQAALSGNVTACIFWLKCRRRDRWFETQRHELTGAEGRPIEVTDAREALVREVEDFLRSRSVEG